MTTAIETIARYHDQLEQVDLVVVTGDLTDHGLDSEYTEFCRLISDLEIPFIAVPGNHDNREAMRQAFRDRDWMPANGPINIRADLSDGSVLAIDTLVTGEPYGALSRETLDWLGLQLDALVNRPVLVALHHPPIATGLALMDAQGLHSTEDLAGMLSRHSGPCALVAGHAHRLICGSFGGHNVTVCPGTSHAVAFDLRAEKSESLVMEPGGVLIHDVGDGFRTHLLPCGKFEGPFPFRS